MKRNNQKYCKNCKHARKPSLLRKLFGIQSFQGRSLYNFWTCGHVSETREATDIVTGITVLTYRSCREVRAGDCGWVDPYFFEPKEGRGAA